jgi:hypothetical protein
VAVAAMAMAAAAAQNPNNLTVSLGKDRMGNRRIFMETGVFGFGFWTF